MNKKILITILTCLIPTFVLAEHRFGVNASNISLGELAPARVSPSSFTLQGNQIRLTDLAFASNPALTGNVSFYAPALATAQSTAAFNASTTSLASGSGFRAGIVRSSHIANATILGTVIASGTIFNANIATHTISTAAFANGVIVSSLIADNTVASVDILDNDITSADILNLTILGADIANNTISNTQLVDNTISHVDMADQTLTGTEISSTAVLYVTSVTATGSFSSSGSIRGGTFYGDGSNLTGISAGGSASTNTYASITIGVTSDQGVDVVGNDENAFWTALGRINYAGEIRVRKGNYFIKGASLHEGVTIPATVQVVFETSANVHNSGDNTIFSSSGTIRNLQLNVNGIYGKPAIRLGTNAKLYDTINENIRFGTDGTFSGLYAFNGSSNVLVDGMINRTFISTMNGGATTERPVRYFIKNSSDIVFNNVQDVLEYSSALGGSVSDSQFALVGEVNGLTIQNSKFKTMGNFFSAQDLTKLASLNMFNLEIEINATNGLNDFFGFSAAGLFQSVSFDGMTIIGSTRAGTGDNGTPISRGFEFATLTSSSTRLNNITLFNRNNPIASIFTNFLFQSGTNITGTLLTNCNIRAATTLVSNTNSTSRIGHNVLFNGTFQNQLGGIADP